LRNSLPDKEDASSPIERFSRVEVGPHLKENHRFGCPVYALNNRLQSGNRTPKWDPRARLGIYLGPSPRHASSVSLVLSLETGLVSPQYHVRHDDFFETVRPSSQNPSTLSMWQSLAGLKEVKTMPVSEGAITMKDDADKSNVIERHVETVPTETKQQSPDNHLEMTNTENEDQTTTVSNEADSSQQSEDNVSNQQQQEIPII
jgi:hypothetical protein